MNSNYKLYNLKLINTAFENYPLYNFKIIQKKGQKNFFNNFGT